MSTQNKFFTPYPYESADPFFYYNLPVGRSHPFISKEACAASAKAASDECAARGWVLKSPSPEIKSMTSVETCAHCGQHYEVTFSSSFQDAEDSLAEQMEIDGWHDGNCPECMHEHGREIARQEDADHDYSGEESDEV